MKCFSAVGRSKAQPFEDVWRDGVKKVSKLSAGSLCAQALGQLTISGLARYGQADLDDHLRLRAPC